MREFTSDLSKLEYNFNELFNDQIETIRAYEDTDEPLLLKEVLTMGFNNVIFNRHRGYCVDDFDEEELNTKVSFDYWDYDNDWYREVYLYKIDE